jgi:hypothetical protein
MSPFLTQDEPREAALREIDGFIAPWFAQFLDCKTETNNIERQHFEPEQSFVKL